MLGIQLQLFNSPSSRRRMCVSRVDVVQVQHEEQGNLLVPFWECISRVNHAGQAPTVAVGSNFVLSVCAHIAGAGPVAQIPLRARRLVRLCFLRKEYLIMYSSNAMHY